MKKDQKSLKRSTEVLVTSEEGHKVAKQENVTFQQGMPIGDVIEVHPGLLNQTLEGIGSSITEASAFVLAHLAPDVRADVMDNIFSERGANFSLVRVPIASCDFCVEGRYSYAERKDDVSLKHFSIKPDKDGFSTKQYPDIKDESYDLLPMIKEALSIKSQQQDVDLNIVASAWTAPPWMKDLEDWYQPGTPDNYYKGTGGILKPEYESVFADYLIKYLQEYQKEGVQIWGMTPVNEPLGNSGQWESMHFTPESQNSFIKRYLGPRLHDNGYKNLQLLIYDHSRDELEQWADVIYRDKDTAGYVSGAAVHWYESTFKVYEDVFDRVHANYPDYMIMHTEGCIDNLGNEAPSGILDPEGYRESGWFDNDHFWWNDNATDWAYTATWKGVVADDHPVYTPVHRYARNIIVSINHWLSGWIDWNIVLDSRGGPNHVGNYCGAPIMIDTDSGHIYYTPLFYILSQLSQTIRPGDRVVQTEIHPENLEDDVIYACASVNINRLISIQILNTSKKSQKISIKIGRYYAPLTIQSNSLTTVRVPE